MANTYPNLALTLIEGMQNGIDADATRVLVVINLQDRTVYLVDNGSGVPRDKFESALASVGRSVKSKDRLGKFGLGLISPLDKCKRFEFTSMPIGTAHPLSWTFCGDDLRLQHSQTVIPCKTLTRMPQIPRRFSSYVEGDFDVTWHTMVKLIGVTEDKVVSLVNLDQLESEVRHKLGGRMRERGVCIRVVLVNEKNREEVRDINPVSYSGEPLDMVTYTQPVCGEVQFELYRAPKLAGQRRGQVTVTEMDNSYGVPIAALINQARTGGWGDAYAQAFAALGSGYFEGVIRCKNIELHPGRTKFQYNDELQTFYMVIGQWFDECGKHYFEDEQVTTREERYQDLSLKSQKRIREILLNQPQFVRLWDGLKGSVAKGRLGSGHLDPETGKRGDTEGDNSIRSGQGGAGVERKKGTGDHNPSGGGRQREPKDRPGDTPNGVMGPRGKRRQLVTGDSQGLWFEYSWSDNTHRLWEFDFTSGILTFNVRHWIWVKLDESKGGKHTPKNDRWIMALQEWLTLEVLTLLGRYSDVDEFEHNRDMLDSKIDPFVELFIIS